MAAPNNPKIVTSLCDKVRWFATRLALKLAPWRGSSLVSMAIKAVSTGGPSVRLLKPSWREVNPRNTSVLGSECVLLDVNRQEEGKSAHLCLWFNVDLPASSFSSSSLVTPLPLLPNPLPSLSVSHSHSDEAVWLTTNFFLCWHTTNNDSTKLWQKRALQKAL